MTTNQLASILGIEEWPSAYQETLDRFCAEWESIRLQDVLCKEDVEAFVDDGFLNAECVNDLLACAARIEQNEDLKFAFFAVYYALCVYRGPHQNEFYAEPCVAKLEEYRYTFMSVLLVKILMKGVADARAKGIGEELIAEHCGAANADYLEDIGTYGVRGMFHWRAVCCFGTMYHCGAFRYEPERVPPGYRMVRRKADGKLLMLYTAAVSIDEYGQFTNDEPTIAFTTTAAKGMLDGYVIAADGRMLNRYVELSADEWELVFDGGDAALSFHIPSSIPYNADAAADSFKKAVGFYTTYYPEFAWKSIQSYSWLYSPQLRFMLAPTSGIVKMNDQLYLAPVPSGPDGFYDFVFHMDGAQFDVETVPTDTSLKRGFVEYVKSGHRVHNGFMYLPFACVDAFDEKRDALYASDMYQ